MPTEPSLTPPPETTSWVGTVATVVLTYLIGLAGFISKSGTEHLGLMTAGFGGIGAAWVALYFPCRAVCRWYHARRVTARREHPPFTVILAHEDRWEEGVRVMLAVQQDTGLPDLGQWPPARYAQSLREQQAQAAGVWLALVGSTAVGHALLTPVAADDPRWSSTSDPEVVVALSDARLVEIDALGVAYEWQQRGAGGALVCAQISWVATSPGMLMGAPVRRDSPGEAGLAARLGRRVVTPVAGPCDLYVTQDADATPH
jgi:hypothetical protein